MNNSRSIINRKIYVTDGSGKKIFGQVQIKDHYRNESSPDLSGPG